ncbi:MAG: hypothetical protein WBM37_00800 [Nitrososphaeraceae archaeon]
MSSTTIATIFLTGLSITTTSILAISIVFQTNQIADAQEMSGDITAPTGENPFGGQNMGTIIVDSSGRRTNVSADINSAPNEGNVLEGWLVDEGSGYKLSLGQFRNGTLDSSQYMVNPYTYNNFEVTEEPAEDPDPNAADTIAGFELKTPFGR